ncbi:MAG: sensor histidine kinase [Paenibacillaceae bacterium]
MRSILKYPTKLFTLIVLCFFGFNVFLLLASGILFYSTYTDLAYREIKETKIDLLDATSEKLSNYVTGIEDTALFLVTNEMIRDNLSSEPENFFDFRSKSKDIYEHFQKMLSVKIGVHSIELYTDRYRGYVPVQDQFLYSLKDADQQGWYEHLAIADGFWITSHPYDGATTGTLEMVSYVHRIIGNRGNTLGIIKINIPDQELFRIVSKQYPVSGSDDYYVLMDSVGQYIASTLPTGLTSNFGSYEIVNGDQFAQIFREHPNRLEDGVISGRIYNAIHSNSSSPHWKLIQLIPTDVFLESRREIQLLTIGLLGVLIVISIPIIVWISKKLTSPIREIVTGMNSLEKGDFNVRLKSSNIHEYQYLSTHFNRMVNRLRELIWQLNKENSDRREAEMHLLQAQIKPHFLYNTLDLIHWRALDYEAHDISQMVHQLSKLFRIGLSNDKWYVSLKDELMHANCYITIQQYRYNFGITYSEHIDNDLFDCLIPKIVLQPFLENAVVHGFRDHKDKTTIQVKVESKLVLDEQQLWLTITDNGCGLPEGFDIRSSKGIGIHNVIDRIQLYCGLRYGVDIHPRAEGGTEVRIRLPLIRDEEEIERLRRSLSHHEYDSLGG